VKLDLAVVAAEAAVPAAGMFTTNRVQAAPVLYCKEALQGGLARAIVVNSGNANACTGTEGLENAREMAQLVATALGSRAEEVLVCSTGVIGQQLPMPAVRRGIPSAIAGLSRSHEAAAAAAQAILTTDTSAKACACRVELSGGSVVVGGIAKGSGMIAPDLELAPHATTLAFLTTDAVLESQAVAASLERAIAGSFNAITVDSDTSTNDTVLLLASGASGVAPNGAADQERLQLAISQVARRLALDVIRDGEGASRVLQFDVLGAASVEQARRVARSLADSPLVKTAFHAGEPNWGRLLMAVGKGDRQVDPDRIAIDVGGLRIVEKGLGTEHDAAELSHRMVTDDVLIEVDLGLGEERATVWGCDLSAEYVRINATYLS
jgi:glutamate N-acetyltransferase/amino-acid N-acetyltransferase